MLFRSQTRRPLQSRRGRASRPLLEDLEVRRVPAAFNLAPGVDPTVSIGDLFGSRPQGYPVPLSSSYSPQQIRLAYGIDQIAFGTIQGTGAGQTIAIVDAYDDPNLVDSSNGNFAISDLARFDQEFDLPDPPRFTKLNQYGTDIGGSTVGAAPSLDPAGAGNPRGNWEAEEALDVEWAHAIAPDASLILVECNSASSQDLYTGVAMAADLPGVSVVSMSWGSAESSSELASDGVLTTPSGHQGVTFVAATGDTGSPGDYPAASPNVVAVGGTSLTINWFDTYAGETAWSGSGGGTSQDEEEPAYQEGVQSTGMRTIPDVSFDADPNTGVAVYDSYNNGTTTPWSQIGGTSLATPCWAGLIAVADQGRVAEGGTTLDGPSQTLPALYALPASDFHDITTGDNGGFSAGPGYDEVTGLGSPVASSLVPDLAGYDLPSQLVVTSGPPSSITAGNPFGLTVAVEDTLGDLITPFNGNVTISLANNPGTGALGGTLTVAASHGIATFAGLTLTTAGAGYTLQVSVSGGAVTATTSPLNVTPGAATQLVVTTQPPASMVAGTSFGLVVSAEDSYGNVDTSFGGNVTIALAGDPGDGALGGTLTVAASQGVATFAGLTLTTAGTSDNLEASAGDLSPATTQTFDDHARRGRETGRDHRASQLGHCRQRVRADGRGRGRLRQCGHILRRHRHRHAGGQPRRRLSRRPLDRHGEPRRGHVDRSDSGHARQRLHSPGQQRRPLDHDDHTVKRAARAGRVARRDEPAHGHRRARKPIRFGPHGRGQSTATWRPPSTAM